MHLKTLFLFAYLFKWAFFIVPLWTGRLGIAGDSGILERMSMGESKNRWARRLLRTNYLFYNNI